MGRLNSSRHRKRTAAVERRWQYILAHQFAIVEHHYVAHHVLQLAHIAGPGVVEQYPHSVGIEILEALVLLLGISQQEVARQQQYVFAALPQWRQGERDHVQTVVKILTKTPRLDLHQGIPVGGADEAHVHRLHLAAADPLQGTGLDEAQQLALQVEIHLADLVEEQGATVRQAGRPLAIPLGAGERSLHMTEDLALHQIVGNGGAVERDEGLTPARTALVDGLGTHLLAGAALPRDEHGRLARRRALYDAIDSLHRHGGADEARKGAALEVLPILGHQRAELLVLEGVARRGTQPLAIERLGQEIEGTAAHRLHRHVHRAVGGDHHHRAGQLLLGDLLQYGHAGHVRQFEVEQHHGGRAGQQLRQCLLTAIGQHYVIAILNQVLLIDDGQTAGIFHQQDTGFAFSHEIHPCD